MTDKLPTIKEIAQRLNISKSTVSRALHNHHSIGLRTKMRVQELAKELNYEPNQTAIFFQKGKTFSIGVILPDLGEPFFSKAISGIEDCAAKNNYTVLLAQSHDDVELEKRIVDTLKGHRVDGVLVSISKNTASYDHFEALKRYNIPVVFFDRIPKLNNIHFVACNLQRGTEEAVQFLLSAGHKIIGLINGPDSLIACRERFEGYKQAILKSGGNINPTLVVSTDLTRAKTYACMKKLLSLKETPTAIVTFNDMVVLDAIDYAKSMRSKSTRPISFVSHSNLPFLEYLDSQPLASVEQFPYLQGQKATEMLLDLISRSNSVEPAVNAYYKIILESQLVLHKTKNKSRSVS